MALMGGSPKKQKVEPVAPAAAVPTAANAADASLQMTDDIRRRRGAFLATSIAGETGTSNTGGKAFLG